MKTGRTVSNHILVFAILDTEKGACLLIDTAISGDRNVIKKRAVKF
jgi:hypothetical protein